MLRCSLLIALTACGARTGLGQPGLQHDAGEHDSGVATNDASIPDDGGVTGDSAVCEITPGPLAYYPLDNDTLDYSGNASDGQGNALVAVTGKIGGAYHFNGSDSSLRAGPGPTLAAARSLCGWIRPSPRSGLGQPFFSSTGDFLSISASAPSGGTCKALLANVPFLDHSGSADCARASLTVSPGAWNLVCYVYDGSSITFFTNGSVTSVPGTLYDHALGTIMMGSSEPSGPNTDSSLDGDLDELSIWDRALGAGELDALWHGGAGCNMRGVWSGG
jgi:hypothetical protein